MINHTFSYNNLHKVGYYKILKEKLKIVVRTLICYFILLEYVRACVLKYVIIKNRIVARNFI